ncbi:MAG TPA: hypothetical protein VGE07_18500, partial [Herpetosiphonaceae bacterium]
AQRSGRANTGSQHAGKPEPARPPGAPPLAAEDVARHAAHPDFHIRLVAAGDPAAPPDLLRALAADPQLIVRHAVACNPAAPADVLERLADYREGSRYPFARDVAYNPGAADELFARTIERLEPWEAVRNPRLGPERRREWIWRLFDEHLGRGWDALCLLASLLAHPQCPPDRLERALASPHWLHRYAVARNPAASAALLEQLAGDAHQLIRFAANQARAAHDEPPG